MLVTRGLIMWKLVSEIHTFLLLMTKISVIIKPPPPSISLPLSCLRFCLLLSLPLLPCQHPTSSSSFIWSAIHFSFFLPYFVDFVFFFVQRKTSLEKYRFFSEREREKGTNRMMFCFGTYVFIYSLFI